MKEMMTERIEKMVVSVLWFRKVTYKREMGEVNRHQMEGEEMEKK